MGNYHYIVARNNNIINVLDTNSFEMKQIGVQRIQALTDMEDFNCKEVKYNADKHKVVHSFGTVICKDDKLKFYWVAYPDKKSTKVTISLIAYNAIESYIRSHRGSKKFICNSSLTRLIDVNTLYDDPYDLSNYTVIKEIVVQRQFKKLTIYEYLSQYESSEGSDSQNTGQSNNKEDTLKTESQTRKNSLDEQQKTEDIDEKNNEALGQSAIVQCENQDITSETKNEKIKGTDEHIDKEDTLSSREADLKLREDALKSQFDDLLKREELLNKKIKQLKVKEDTLKKAMYKMDNVGAYTLAEVVLDVKNIFTFEESETKPRDKSVVFPDYTYELILKSLSKGDIVSAPKKYVTSLDCTRLRYLETLHDIQGYAALEKIRFNKALDESLIAIVEYSDTNPDVKIYICREYDINNLTNDDIVIYTTSYISMKRNVLNLGE